MIFALFFCHWYMSGAVPAATTENVADCPAVTVWFAGCVVIVGAVGFEDPNLEVAAVHPHSSNTRAEMRARRRAGRIILIGV